jgi:predicted enzyme related to lactoylglutathione lyase
MSDRDVRPSGHGPLHGEIGYLQLPALDIADSAAFYESVFGWSVDRDHGSFTAAGTIGQWTTARAPAHGNGPVVWLCVEGLTDTMARVVANGGTVRGRPQLDSGERLLVEIEDPAGNHVGMVATLGMAQSQTMLAVRDVEASSRWYQRLLGLQSGHGGPEYERLLADGVLVLQLHDRETEHHHGRIGDAEHEAGYGVLVWFGEVADFDGVVERATELGAPVVLAPHRNPPPGEGNGPSHREIWIRDPDGYTVVIASPDGEAFEPEEVADNPSSGA